MNPVKPRYNLGRWHGHPTVSPAPIAAAIRVARAAGITSGDIARATGIHPSHLRNYAAGRSASGQTEGALLLSSTAERILDALEYLIAQRRNRLNAALGALKRARPLMDSERLPSQPLLDLITRSCGSVKSAVTTGRMSDADRRQLYRYDNVDLGLADRLCLEFGTMLEDVYGMEGAA